jgi:predicted Zn-dependent peptidase
MYMGLETTDSLVEFYADQEITRGKLFEPKYFEESLRKISGKDLLKVAQGLFKTEKLNLAVVGESETLPRLKKLLVL